MSRSRRRRGALVGCVLVALVAFGWATLRSSLAVADVRFDGAWDKADAPVALDVSDVPLSEALRRLAAAAGWSLVVADPPSERVDLHVKDQSARKVLEILLARGSYVASRDGDLVAVRRAEEGLERNGGTLTPPAPPPPPPPPPPRVAAEPPLPPLNAVASSSKHHGEDRTITGGNYHLAEGESAHDVTVYGGNADILGNVTGDLSVFGGKGRVGRHGHVLGDVTVMGGALRMDDGARIDGDVAVLGSKLDRAAGATVGGSVTNSGGDSGNDADHKGEEHENEGLLHSIGSAITRTALLFVFGAVLLALGGSRMESLRAEVAKRPMRSFALGVVGLVASVAVLVALCVTLVGIPVAIVGGLLGAVAAYAGVAAVLTTLGEALLRHRTESPYVHLAFGCALLLVVGAIPLVGGLVKAVVALMGIGVLFATRAAGFVPVRPDSRPPEDA